MCVYVSIHPKLHTVPTPRAFFRTFKFLAVMISLSGIPFLGWPGLLSSSISVSSLAVGSWLLFNKHFAWQTQMNGSFPLSHRCCPKQ